MECDCGKKGLTTLVVIPGATIKVCPGIAIRIEITLGTPRTMPRWARRCVAKLLAWLRPEADVQTMVMIKVKNGAQNLWPPPTRCFDPHQRSTN